MNTREVLVDTARKLFAESGLDKITMNDIAAKSGKGRRTLYMYFKNKNEVYWAVVESELQILAQRLEEMKNQDLSPEEKLKTYIDTRLEAVREAVMRNGSLQADFFRDRFRVDIVRRNIEKKEMALIRDIFEEGVRKGAFQIRNIEAATQLLHFALKGLDIPYISGRFKNAGISDDEVLNGITKLILGGIRNKA